MQWSLLNIQKRFKFIFSFPKCQKSTELNNFYIFSRLRNGININSQMVDILNEGLSLGKLVQPAVLTALSAALHKFGNFLKTSL